MNLIMYNIFVRCLKNIIRRLKQNIGEAKQESRVMKKQLNNADILKEEIILT